jgi:putative heme-binding domain-containing protein
MAFWLKLRFRNGRAIASFALALGGASLMAQNAPLELHTRARQETAQGSGHWLVTEKTVQWDPHKTAIIICDMWNQHWCRGATARVAEMAPRMNQVISEARRCGIFIIHCPSETMKFYEGTPARKLAQAAPMVTPRVPFGNCGLDRTHESELPIDDSDGGCDDVSQCPGGSPWTHEIDTLEIKDGDAVTDSVEAYYLLRQRGIENVIIMGVHGNMCVLGRPFSIRQMVREGKNVLLMRDMVDTMYNSRKAPYVSHFAGTDLVVEHIEKYWCPSITSADFLGGAPFHFKADKRPHIVFIIGENEYHTWETLPRFARETLTERGLDCSFVEASSAVGDNFFTNYNLIKGADLLVLSVRRRTPPKEMMALIRQHLEAGKPLAGIRTASHAFGATPPDSDHEGWTNFDTEILGASYQNHYNNPGAIVSVLPEQSRHPVVQGIPAGPLPVTSTLYKYRSLAPSVTAFLSGKPQDGSASEPVAWIDTARDRRVFYTSLGAPDDFNQPFFRRLLLNGILWCLNQSVPPAAASIEFGALQPQPSPPSAPAAEPQKQALSPQQALAAFHIDPDFEIDQVLAEPAVRKPVFMNFDERGRLWVVQYLQYPNPAGLRMQSRDSVWRAVYDLVPPPPPRQFPGADKISIFEDTTGTGIFDKETTFVEGLNIVTAVVKGRGGVWVLNPPYLLFYPDKNSDDIPNGPPEVVLSGFGLEDTHSVVNSLRWGPDGWLYGCQGSTVTANVIRPGIDAKPIASTMGQQIWRYHPETRRFEVFSEGGGNAFGCEIDAKGRIFSGHNGGDTRGFHYMQGAYLQKGFEKHGPLSNPYAFGYFPPMPHPPVERFTHNFILYDGGAFPAAFAGKLFGIEPLQGRVVESEMAADGSSFTNWDLGHPVTTSDRWFRPVDIKVGPDGAIYLADWYDSQINHYVSHEEIDKTRGRIYRLRPKGARPIQPFDLGKLSTAELAGLLSQSNKWFRQEALRLIGDRKDASAIPLFTRMTRTNTGQLALESLWALNLSGGFTDEIAAEMLRHADPYVRMWAARLLGDQETVSAPLAAQLAAIALTEPSVEVRAQLACTAKRLPAPAALPIVTGLLRRNEDAAEKRIPLLLWWAIESKCEDYRDAVLAVFSDTAVWSLPIVREAILSRLMRRFAMAGTHQDLLTCARLLKLSPGPEQTAKLMAGFEEALQGRTLTALPDELLAAMAEKQVRSLLVELRRAEPEAVDEALALIADHSANLGKRLQYLEIFAEIKQPKALPLLLKIIEDPKEQDLQPAAFAALQQFDDPAIGREVAARLKQYGDSARPAAMTLLASRPVWALDLAQAVEDGAAGAVPQDTVQKLKLYKQKEIVDLVRKRWPEEHVPTTAEMRAKIDHCAAVIAGGSGDPYAGRTLFTKTCGVCHKLFGQGAQIGPDLTSCRRDDLDNLLVNIVNPSAQIREGYETYFVTTKDGRSLSGFLVDKNPKVVVLRGIDGVSQVLPQEQIDELQPSRLSLMPEGLLDPLSEQQLRDLFAYLRSSQPLVGQPPHRLSSANN